MNPLILEFNSLNERSRSTSDITLDKDQDPLNIFYNSKKSPVSLKTIRKNLKMEKIKSSQNLN
jgi:hypothetical protein